MVAVSVFLTSFNKPGYVLDAIRSVINQASGDWELWILENSTDGKTRQVIKDSGVLKNPKIIYEEIDIDASTRARIYPPAMLLNRYYPKANGEFIIFLADDDL